VKSALRGAITTLAYNVSPAHRRWRQLLDGLRIDEAALTGPIEHPSARDFMICGSPRSGTTLLSAVLWQPPRVVTVSEPWDGLRMLPSELFASIRREIAATGELRRGRLDVEKLIETGEVVWGRDGDLVAPADVDDDFLLGVKWPAFWRYVPLLPHTKFLVCIRDPVEVITSYRTHGGDLVRGQDYDCSFNRVMNQHLRQATGDLALRRVLLYDYINARLLPYLEHPNVYVVRYERWFEERDTMVAEIGEFLGASLGPGRPAIRTPRKGAGSDDAELSLIRANCKTAPALGYPVGD